MAHSDALHFLRAFVLNPGRVGAVVPSSPALARAMVQGLSLAPGEAVLEYGPGTGPFTTQIARVLPGPEHYLGIERDRRFVTLLRARHPHLHFVEGSAEDAPQLAAKAGLRTIAAVISGLPFATLPDAVQQGILAGLDQVVAPGRLFRTFQYVHAYQLPQAVRFRRRMGQLFGPHQRSTVIWANLPPAFVLTWRRK